MQFCVWEKKVPCRNLIPIDKRYPDKLAARDYLIKLPSEGSWSISANTTAT